MTYKVTRQRYVTMYAEVEAADWDDAIDQAKELEEDDWSYSDYDERGNDWSYEAEEDE